jgi:hypothetical protein
MYHIAKNSNPLSRAYPALISLGKRDFLATYPASNHINCSAVFLYPYLPATVAKGKNIVAEFPATAPKRKNIVAGVSATVPKGKNIVAGMSATMPKGKNIVAGVSATVPKGKNIVAEKKKPPKSPSRGALSVAEVGTW